MSGGATGETQAGSTAGGKGERIAKVMARAGLCSRRDAERWIAAGRVTVNGRVLSTPAVTVGPKDRVEVDGTPLVSRERTRLWLFHKPRGLVTTNRDPEGRPTVFSALPRDMPRVVSVGRLDIGTEGLLLLTNDGGLARILELPSTGWLRRYRVRAHGKVEQPALDALAHGVTIEGMVYGAIEAELERIQGTNVWLTMGLREGKNREVKRVLEHLGLSVNRLIRISYGPFQLGDLEPGEVREVRGRVLRDQLGEKLARAANADFDAPIREPARPGDGRAKRPAVRAKEPVKAAEKRSPRAHRRRPA
jgi:23S rRNA pseudouridine2605 synthase